MPPLSFILFSEENGPDLERLLAQIKPLLTGMNIGICHSLDEMRTAMAQRIGVKHILMMMLDSRVNCDAAIRMRQQGLLNGHRIIAVVPDLDSERVKKCLELLPTYVATMDSDFSDVRDIVKTIIEKNG